MQRPLMQDANVDTNYTLWPTTQRCG